MSPGHPPIDPRLTPDRTPIVDGRSAAARRVRSLTKGYSAALGYPKGDGAVRPVHF
jgi:hypothetical protein